MLNLLSSKRVIETRLSLIRVTTVAVLDGLRARVRWHPRGRGLIDRIVDECLLGAEKIPGDAAHQQHDYQ
jgi:hypothetical protein